MLEAVPGDQHLPADASCRRGLLDCPEKAESIVDHHNLQSDEEPEASPFHNPSLKLVQFSFHMVIESSTGRANLA
jgi:hypothetical protein